LRGIASEASLPLCTAQRWVNRYRQFGLIGLIRAGRTDHGKRRRVADNLRCLAEGLALERPPHGPSTIYREICRIARARGEQPPGYHTIYNVIRDPGYPRRSQNPRPDLSGEKAYREPYDLRSGS
jgi:putative transposase